MSSIALRVFNFPPMFNSVDVREFLHLFGLETVRFIKRRNADGAIVSVDNESEARLVIARLHQLLIKTHRLKVEYSNENEPASFAGKEATKHKTVGMPEQRCFPLGFEGFPPPHLAYRYPKSSPEILENITKELASNSALYYQTLHLMNKMNLKPPFESRQKENTITPNAPEESSQSHPASLSEEESELESDSEVNSTRKTNTSNNLLKRTMKVVNYEPSSVELQTTQKPPKKAKLEINISGALLTASQPASHGNNTVPGTTENIPSTLEEAPTLSIEDILSNRIPDEQRNTLHVFQNYCPGEPTNKLYIKNLAKQVTELDLIALFGVFFQAKLLKTIDVRLMKTGRMKGQAFVTFVPLEEDEDTTGSSRFRQCVERALSTVNGYILKDKPVVVSYAKGV
ncbi:RNA-binding region-containing protein 3 [Anopheles moucheti]|uniref:RNA-binding region-containing protein 3 n=1 Tax=Anopheles moucheti TaxID=186751 RepID=UPI0022F02BF7|nr:RNA-binding region-containing protein 3 [Anopheles moucheti]